MTDRVYQLLDAPRRTRYQIKQLEAKRQAVEYAMMPGGIRYDKDKVQTSPSDQMPERAAELDEIDRRLLSLKDRYLKEVSAIEEACHRLTDDAECTVLIMRYIGGDSVRRIGRQLSYSRSGVYAVMRRGCKNLDAVLQE